MFLLSVLTQKEIVAAIREAGLSGKAVCVHSSFRSFGVVEGGPDTVIDAFLECSCTLLVPTFTSYSQYHVSPPIHERIPHNGIDYEGLGFKSSQKYYSEYDNEISAGMGVIPSKMLNRKGRIRGIHPLLSFAALGDAAEDLISAQTYMNPFGPLMELSKLDGAVVLVGVDLRALTAIHLAQEYSGGKLFTNWVNDPDGKPFPVKVGTCSSGFNKFEPILHSIEKCIEVGASKWRLYNARVLIDKSILAIRNNPLICHCDSKECLRCKDFIINFKE